MLQRFLDEGQVAWPEIGLSREKFSTFLLRHFPAVEHDPTDLTVLRAADLFLVCAYGHGDNVAYQIVETRYMPKVRHALLRASTEASLIADIEQNIRRILLEMHDAAITRRGYSGRSELSAWLCLCAIRAAVEKRQHATREHSLDETEQSLMPAELQTPEFQLLSLSYKEVFRAVFSTVLQGLTPRERNLIRFHYLHDLSIDQIAMIYKIHRATAARWLGRVQRLLIVTTRQRFLEQVVVSLDSLPRVRDLIAAQLSFDLDTILMSAAEPESSVS